MVGIVNYLSSHLMQAAVPGAATANCRREEMEKLLMETDNEEGELLLARNDCKPEFRTKALTRRDDPYNFCSKFSGDPMKASSGWASNCRRACATPPLSVTKKVIVGLIQLTCNDKLPGS